MARKEEVIHLDMYFAEIETKRDQQTIILTGSRENSRLKNFERPVIKIRIKADRFLPEHIAHQCARIIKYRKDIATLDMNSFANEVKIALNHGN